MQLKHLMSSLILLIFCVSEKIAVNYFVDDTSLNTLGKFIRVHDVTCLPNVMIPLHSDVDVHGDEQIFAVDNFFMVIKHCCFVEVSLSADGNFFEYC